jgi:RimJ/RimL family protein N-acetyltransferase
MLSEVMEIRPIQRADVDDLAEIDGTVESSQYLHLERTAEGLAVTWKLTERMLREPRIERNRLSEDAVFVAKQIATGADEGLAAVAEHEGRIVGLLIAQPQPQFGTLRIVDLRVDFDVRREGLGTAMLFQAINHARELELRAVTTETRTDNVPAARLLQKCAFDLAGVDTQRHTNHDLVKEVASLIWYAALD